MMVLSAAIFTHILGKHGRVWSNAGAIYLTAACCDFALFFTLIIGLAF